MMLSTSKSIPATHDKAGFDALEWTNEDRIMISESVCEWKEDSDGNWETECQEVHAFIDGGPADNSYEFCPYCGKRLRMAP